MAFALKQSALRAGGRRCGNAPRPPLLHRVAAIDQPAISSEQHAAGLLGGEAPELEQQLAVHSLDEAQEGLLKWMLFLDSDQQEADLEAGEGPEDPGDEEYADIFDDVEAILEEGEVTFKVGETVYGTVYEVDDDGAYVEIGAKAAGFVPTVECSLGRVKSVRHLGARGGPAGAGRTAAASAAARLCGGRPRLRSDSPPTESAPPPPAPTTSPSRCCGQACGGSL